MSLFNEIQVGRFNRLAQKLFSMKGGPPLPTLSSDLTLEFPLSNGIGNRYLEGFDLFARQANITLFAANFSALELRNPANSNVLGEVFYMDASNPTAAMGISVTSQRGATTDQPTLLTAFALDARTKRSNSIILSSNTGAALVAVGGTPQPILFEQVQPTTNLIWLPPGMEAPLLPGDALIIQGSTAAQGFSATFWWRERALEDSERT